MVTVTVRHLQANNDTLASRSVSFEEFDKVLTHRLSDALRAKIPFSRFNSSALSAEQQTV